MSCTSWDPVLASPPRQHRSEDCGLFYPLLFVVSIFSTFLNIGELLHVYFLISKRCHKHQCQFWSRVMNLSYCRSILDFTSHLYACVIVLTTFHKQGGSQLCIFRYINMYHQNHINMNTWAKWYLKLIILRISFGLLHFFEVGLVLENDFMRSKWYRLLCTLMFSTHFN